MDENMSKTQTLEQKPRDIPYELWRKNINSCIDSYIKKKINLSFSTRR